MEDEHRNIYVIIHYLKTQFDCGWKAMKNIGRL